MKKKQRNHSEIFFSSFIDDLNNSSQDISQTLKDHSVDENSIAQKARDLAGRLLAKMKLQAAKASKQTLLQKAAYLLQQPNSSVSGLQSKQRLYELLSINKQVAVTFNSLKDFSTEDVLQMLSEIQLIDLVEKLENNE